MMSKIRSKDTKPEITLRKAFFAKGFRYRINDKKLPGKPDIVFPKYKTIIFVHGCFWHDHKGCKRAHLPKSNTNYWENKIRRNKERDAENQELLSALGWKICIVWECETNKKEKLKSVVDKIITENLQKSATNHNTIKIKIYEEVNSAITQVAEDEMFYSNSKNEMNKY